MKLSEALRLGSEGRCQIRGDYKGRCKDGSVGVCALGAIIIGATGKLPYHVNADKANDCVEEAFQSAGFTWPGNIPKVENPATGEITIINHAIGALNDNQRWSFEQIATWLEGIGF